MRSWHPLSKLIVFAGLGTLALVLWLDHDKPTDARAAAALPPTTVAEAAAPATRVNPTPAPTGASESHSETRPLLPVDAFASMVDRPLFAPARRPIDPPIELAELDAVQWTMEPAAPPLYPSVGFVGSIEENGRLRALLGDGFEVRSVSIGEMIEGWTVLAIDARRLTLGYHNEILELTIFE